ncbi:MAG: SDR family oxidoreductase [Dermatophilaceae bacterium]
MRMEDQRLLVIGTGAMAIATAVLAAQEGAQVTISSRDADRSERAAVAAGAGVVAAVADPEDVAGLTALMERLTPLDHVAVLVGGVGARAGSIRDTPHAEAKAAFGRFWASYNVVQVSARHVRPEGSVTLLSGSSGRRGVAGLGVWGALHGSIEALARAAALELSPIRVNTVSPGGIGITTDRQLTPHRGQPEDVAAAVVGLAANPAVTGALLDVDGGERLGTYSA